MPKKLLNYGRDGDLGNFGFSHYAIMWRASGLWSYGVLGWEANWVAFKFEHLEGSHIGEAQRQFPNLVLGHRQDLERR